MIIIQHSKNILLNDLIADFGISKQLNDTTDSSSSSNLKDTVPYTDPRCLLQNNQQDKESDIYSLGMLLWELTSGIHLFSVLNLNISRLIIHISENKKVAIIDQTPPDYAYLFEKCWSSDLNQRPTLSEILKELKKLSVNAPVDFISNKFFF
ncbi:kinase-like protein [Gigaspora margarita]|uniref:Kinase-like protein n=1 Tax=Gigaspora margarita TaxID=4874 RepID=A0A8H4EL01_GIGMA|nr:kinase-like protein [Gigaspora margarita]